MPPKADYLPDHPNRQLRANSGRFGHHATKVGYVDLSSLSQPSLNDRIWQQLCRILGCWCIRDVQ